MSKDLDDQDSPFDSDNPARRRVSRGDIPDSVQSPEREAVEDLTRGKRKRGKTLGLLLIILLLGAGLYYMFGMSGKSGSRHRKDADTLAPSEMAGANVVQQAKDVQAQQEQKRRDEAAAAAAKRRDPNAAAAATIGEPAGDGLAGTGASGTAAGASEAAAAAAAAKKEAEAKAEKEAQIAASPLQATEVQTLRSGEGVRSNTSASTDLAHTLADQMKANQAATERQMDRVMQAATSSSGQTSSTGTSTSSSTNSHATQQDQWLASQKEDDSEATKMHAAPDGPIVSEGTPVRTVLVTGLNTDNPGMVTAMVTSDIYDTVTGHSLMIPKGSRLTGSYNHDIKVGQDRVLIAMTRLVRPDGSWIDLSGTTGAEMDGSSGLEGDVNNHFFKIFGSALVIGAATLLLDKAEQNVSVTASAGTTQLGGTIFAQTLQQVVSDLLSRNANIPPTITRDGGTQFIFLVRHDLAFTPYIKR